MNFVIFGIAALSNFSAHFINFMTYVRFVAIAFIVMAASVNPMFSQVVETRYDYGSSLVHDSRLVYERGLLTRSRMIIEESLREFVHFPAYDKAQILSSLQSASSKSFKTADEILVKLIMERPLSPVIPYAHQLRGMIAFEQQRLDKASIHFHECFVSAEAQFIQRQDSLYHDIAATSLFWRGVSQAKIGLNDSAAVSYKKCYSRFPEHYLADDALFYDGLVHENNNDVINAIAIFARYRSNYPKRNNTVASCIREAQNRLKRRQAAMSLVILENGESSRQQSITDEQRKESLFEVQTNAEHAAEEILFLRGEAYNQLRRYEDALTAYKQLLNDYPTTHLSSQVRLGIGWALLNLNRAEESVVEFSAVIDSIQDQTSQVRAAAQLYRAIAWKNSGKRDEAYREFSTLSVQSGFPFLAQVLLELGQMYYEDGKYTEARRALERGERESSDGFISARIQLILGNSYLEERLFAKAAQAFSSAEFLAKNSSVEMMPLKNSVLAEARLKQGIAWAQASRYRDAIPSLTAFRAEHADDKRQDEALFWLGESFYRSDMLANADVSFRDLVDNFPTSERREEALYGLGWTHFRQRRFDASGKWFEKLVKEYPKTEFAAEALARKGDGHFLERQFATAAKSYEEAAKRAPNTAEGRYSAYQLGHALRRAGQLDRAVDVFRNYVKKYSRSANADYALFSIGLIHFQEQKYEIAINDFRTFIEAYPQSSMIPRAQYQIGDCYYNQGNYQAAIIEYKKVMEQFPTSPYAGTAVMGIQYCLESMGRSDAADSLTRAFINANPLSANSEKLIVNQGYKFYTNKRFNDAIAEYENYLKTYPNTENAAEALFYLGKSYINSGNTLKAEQSMDDLAKKYPANTFAHLGILELGLMRLRMNEATKADSIFRIVEQKYPDSSSAGQALFERSVIAYTRGDTNGALTGFTKVADKFQATEFGDQSLYRIAMFWRLRGQFDSARIHFSKLALREENPLVAAEAQYRIGELYLRERKHNEALTAFLTARDKYSMVEDWFTLSMLGLGECYEFLGQIDAAKDVYATLQELRKDDDYGRTAAARLKRLKKGNYSSPVQSPQKDSLNTKPEQGGNHE